LVRRVSETVLGQQSADRLEHPIPKAQRREQVLLSGRHSTQKMDGSCPPCRQAFFWRPKALQRQLNSRRLPPRIFQGDLFLVGVIQKSIRCHRREGERTTTLDWKARSAIQFELEAAYRLGDGVCKRRSFVNRDSSSCTQIHSGSFHSSITNSLSINTQSLENSRDHSLNCPNSCSALFGNLVIGITLGNHL
jgi:hypothetical protein